MAVQTLGAGQSAADPALDALEPKTLARLVSLRGADRTAFDAELGALVAARRWKAALPLLAMDAADNPLGMEKFIVAQQQLGLPGSLDELALLRLYHTGHIRMPEGVVEALEGKADLEDPAIRMAALRTLFAFEIARGTFLHPKTRSTATFFLRGKVDVQRTLRTEGVMVDRDSPRYREARRHLDVVLPESLFGDSPPRRVCEIGAAWGGSSLSIQDRFKPEEFLNFEIDSDLARQMETELGLKAMPCDGETLNGVDDATMDLVFASGVLYFVPPMKLISYFREMARVCGPGGVVYFNILTAEQMSPRRMAQMIKDPSLRRTFAPPPRSWIDEIFQGFERLPIPEGCGYDPNGEFIFRKPAA